MSILENDENRLLLGKWRTDPDDQETIAEYGDVSLDFLLNGGLIYTVHTEGKRQIMLLNFRVEGDVLVTDQPSDPHEERTKFELTPDGKLVLRYEHRSSTYIRDDKISSSPFPAASTN
jgi:hypothetical protein